MCVVKQERFIYIKNSQPKRENAFYLKRGKYLKKKKKKSGRKNANAHKSSLHSILLNDIVVHAICIMVEVSNVIL